MTARQLRNRVAYLLDYEPSWFAEFGSGLGLMLWSAGAILTKRIHLEGLDYVLPALGLGFGPLRWVLLVRLWYGPRVLAALVSAIWLSWIMCGAGKAYGIIPMLGFAMVPFSLDILTIGRFSAPCARALLAEWRVWRAAR